MDAQAIRPIITYKPPDKCGVIHLNDRTQKTIDLVPNIMPPKNGVENDLQL
jgi:hypothetical protein